jgi:ubiquinone/menaquinone biosynthesis C-methylase UbiE
VSHRTGASVPITLPRRWFGRYTIGARVYGVLSLEWPVYRPGRRVGMDLLQLRQGDRVLDVGCGTGLNLALLIAAVGPTGSVVGVDVSAAMLARARARVRRHRWANVRLVHADAGANDLAALLGVGPGELDAVVFTYSLSIIRDWQAAWRSAITALRPGGRVAVVDLALPEGRWAVFAPLARLLCLTGGVDRGRRVWELVRAEAVDYRQRELRGGHILVSAGSIPGRADGPRQ